MERITSRNNPKIKYACSLKKTEAREREGRLLAEGLRLCADAAANGVPIEMCFLSEQMLHSKQCAPVIEASEQCFLVEEHVAEKLAQTKKPQGIFCVCKMPQNCFELDVAGKYLLLENIADPGNLGTAIRTAEAFGLSGAILVGCCDAFGAKALRAAMGASFRFPLTEDADGSLLQAALSKGMHLYCSVVEPDAQDVKILRGKSGIITAVGNEANGLSERLCARGTKITIHMNGRAESFNASQAATVLMYEMSL